MRSKFTIGIVVFLFLLAIVPIAYKTLVLGLDLFPKNKKDIWEIEFVARIKPDPNPQSVSFGVPEANDRLKILETHFQGKDLSLTINKTAEGSFAHLKGRTTQPLQSYYRVRLEAKPGKYTIPESDFNDKFPKKVTPFLTPIPLSEGLKAAVARLEGELAVAGADHVERARNIYYFMNEEVTSSIKPLGLEAAVSLLRGSSKDTSQLFTILARRQGIPARTVRGISLKDADERKMNIFYWNEVYLGAQWIPVFTTLGYFGLIPSRFIPLYTTMGLKEEGSGEAKVVISAKQMLAHRFNALQYRGELADTESPFLEFSPYILPLSEQAVLKLLLLFAFGTLVLSFFRTVVGVPTFGTFFPILVAVFFKETSLAFGLGFFLLVVLFGCFERLILNRLHLLSVPRFSIILTLLVLTLLISGIVNNHYHLYPYNPAILPIIITTMFIERFSISWEEEGFLNTLHTLLGSLAIAVLSYALFSWKKLEVFIYTHPESLFAVIAVLIMIGKYSGYRLSEFIRFKEFIKRK